MVAIKVERDSGTGALEQMVVAEYFSKHFQSHVDELAGALKDKCDLMVEAVEREFGTAVEPWVPKGGIFLWMKLPDQVDVRKLVQPALKAGIAFNPGPEWAVDGEASKSRLRLCFGLTTKQEIVEGVAAFARVCYEETGIPEQSGNIRHAARLSNLKPLTLSPLPAAGRGNRDPLEQQTRSLRQWSRALPRPAAGRGPGRRAWE